MRIEEGKYYRTRGGRKVGPMARHEYGWTADAGFRIYGADGKRVLGFSGDEPEDLISEWPESPIRTETVTVRRLEPGVYGVLGINGENEKSVRIGFAGVMGDGQYFWVTPTELRELARVALEIAEYLDAQ